MQRLALLLCVAVPAIAHAEFRAENGKARFEPSVIEKELPEGYRLQSCEFAYELKPIRELPVTGVEVYNLTFPSPVKSPYESNNTVHAEYYRPKGEGPYPAVIVLEILAGGEELCKTISLYLASNKVSALFVRMAYYGPRRPPGGKVRLLSPDIPHSVEAIRQTVLDCRLATAWLGSRPEINKERLGIIGTSLGSFVSAVTAAVEPRLNRVALLLGGGSLVDVYYDHPQAGPFRLLNETLGGSKQRLKEIIAPVDPITYASFLQKRDLLIIAASRDDIVPPKAAELLWQASGRQKIVWYETNHYGAALFLIPMSRHVLEHFAKP